MGMNLGHAGTGLMTGHQNIAPAISQDMSRANEPNCVAISGSAIEGQWLAMIMALKTKNATSGCVVLRRAANRRGRRVTRLKVCGGSAIRRSAGAVKPMSRYWTMWTLTR